MSTQEKTLSSVVEISRKFLRSIQIDDDFGREDALSGYVCQGTARTLLESMAQQLLETKQRAFTWTGPYGGGKSSLALMLCSLVGPSKRLRDRAKQILALPSDSRIYKAFDYQLWEREPVFEINLSLQLRSELEPHFQKRRTSMSSPS
jgi:predicted Ser/Thr protein kinase